MFLYRIVPLISNIIGPFELFGLRYIVLMGDGVLYSRIEGDLLIDWDDLVSQDTDDNESQGRLTPCDTLSVDNLAVGATCDSKSTNRLLDHCSL